MRADVVVIGAGLGGLLTARLLRDQGREVRLLDKATPGGRARSQVREGAILNLGPHAVYNRGELAGLLDELGVPWTGGVPGGRMSGLLDGEIHPLPIGPMSLATSPLAAGDRAALMALFAGLPFTSASRWTGRPGAEWLAQVGGVAGQTLTALARVATYCAEPEHLDAGALHQQMQRVLGGVTYLHGGWQTLVDALHCDVERVQVTALHHDGVETTHGRLLADHVVAAVDAASWSRLTGESLERTSVRASCLCVGLDEVRSPESFLLGIDTPMYASVHSAVAKLGTQVVHTARYLRSGEVGDREALRRFTGRLQPGYSPRVERFLPAIEVVGDIPRAGRARASVRASDRVSRVGDWVGERGLLADGVAASAIRAAERALASRAA